MFFSLFSKLRVRLLLLIVMIAVLLLGLAYVSDEPFPIFALGLVVLLAASMLLMVGWIAAWTIHRTPAPVTLSNESTLLPSPTPPCSHTLDQPLAVLSKSEMPLTRPGQTLVPWIDIFQNISVGVVVVNAERSIIDQVNLAFAAMHGYAVQELVGKPWQIISGDASVIQIDTQDHRVTEAIHRRKDGTTFSVHLDSTIVRDEHGSTFKIITVQDLTALKRVEHNLKQQIEHLTAITRLSQEITLMPGLEATLASIARLVTDIAKSDGAVVFALDVECKRRIAASFNVSDALVRSLKEQNISQAKGASGQAVLERRPVEIDDVLTENDYAFRDQVIAAGFRSVIAIPMLHQERVVGGLIFFQRHPHNFSASERDFFQTIAQQCVNAVENAQLFEAERKQRQLAEALHDLAALLTSTLDFDEILNRILGTVERFVPYDTASILFIEDSVGRVIRCRGFAERGLEPWIFSLRFSEQEFGSIADLKTGHRWSLIPDTHIFPGWKIFPETEWIRSALRMPIRHRGKLIGVLTLDSATPNFYTPAHATGLEAFTDQAAVALENARLLAETEQRADQFTALYEMTRDLSGHQNLNLLLNMIVERAIKILHASSGDMFLYDPKAGDLYPIAEIGFKNPSGIRIKLGEGMGGIVAQTRQPLIVNNYHQWDKRLTEYDSIPFVAVLQVPLVYDDELIGVLSLNEIAPSQRQFTDADMRLLSLFAGQAAPAIHSARLLTEARTRAEQLALLYDASLALNNVLEPRTQLAFLFKLTTKAMHVERAEFFRLDKEHQKLVLELAIGGDEQLRTKIANLTFALDDENGIPPWVYRNRVPFYLPDVRLDPRWMTFDPTVRSALWVPVEHEDNLLGVFCVLSPEVNGFTPQDERLLVLFANQTAVALENARLFGETQQRANRLAILNDIASAVNRSANLDQLLEIIYQHINTTMPSDAVCIALYDAATQELDMRKWMDEGVRMPPERHPLQKGLRSRVIETRQALLIGDVETTPNLPPLALWGSMKSPRSWLGVPMKLEDSVIGIITIESYKPNVYTRDEEQLLVTIADQVVVAVQKAHLFEETQRRADRLAILNNVARAASQTLNMDELLELVYLQVAKVLKPDAATIALYNPILQELDYRLRIDEGIRVPSERRVSAVGLNSRLIASATSLLIPDAMALEPPPAASLWGSMKPARSWLGAPMKLGDTILGIINVQAYSPNVFNKEDEQLLVTIADQIALAIQKAQLFEETQHRLEELEAVSKISTALRVTKSVDEMIPLLLDETLAIIGTRVGALSLYDATHKELFQAAARGWFTDTPQRAPVQDGIAGKVFHEGKPYVARNFHSDPTTSELARSAIPDGWGGALVPIRTTLDIIGVLAVAIELPREVHPEQVHLLTAVAEMAGNAIHRAQLNQITEERLNRMNAMHVIDTAISASLDLRVVLNVLLGQVTTQLQVDAANVFILNTNDQTLNESVSRGIRFSGLTRAPLRLGEGYAGRTVIERHMLHVADLKIIADDRRLEKLASEGWTSYFAIPLVSKGQVQGVLEIFHRQRLAPDADWIGFLEILAGQAAIAIENVTLFENLQRTNLDLSLAYDSTIESWARTLDLRVEAMEGHTERMINLTLRLGQAVGIAENELIWLRRGVLLHDIGKLSIPDTILVKPGPLTAYEWQVIRKHPQYAYDLLASIEFLRPAIDIPYCHHEKWDGTGYPRGLKGNEIPIAARIFAIIDVWDALHSARPYRAAWTDAQAREYLRSQSGKHFDPQIVQAFLNLLSES
ncbi:MAG: GAF domain-containing protein [Chloroflexi bacterium]|nr:GAF domain-containing protein [Chloroflexota bacterium]